MKPKGAFKATHRTRCYGANSKGKPARTRAVPGMSYEDALRAEGIHLIAGVDEVGTGSWAGPVAVGMVVLWPDTRLYKVRDSKSVAAARRQFLAAHVRRTCLAWSVGLSWPAEIDAFGLSYATMAAARRAREALPMVPQAYLLDGNWDYLKQEQVRKIVRGDSESVSIASASLVAKVARDALMAQMSDLYPCYGFHIHKGYPSPKHKWALAAFGPSPIHRRLFAPVAELWEGGIPGRLLPSSPRSHAFGTLTAGDNTPIDRPSTIEVSL